MGNAPAAALGRLSPEAVARNFRAPEATVTGWLVTKHFNQRNRFLEENAVKLCHIEPHHRVLAIGFGCGIGIQSAYSQIKDGTGKVCGLDISQANVAKATKRFRKPIKAEKIDISHGDAAHIPYSTDSFDSVFHVNTFYFMKDLIQASAEMHRVLRPDGIMVCTMNQDSLKIARSKGWLQYGSLDPLPFLTSLDLAGFQDIKFEHKICSGRKFQAITANVGKKAKIELPKEEILSVL